MRNKPRLGLLVKGWADATMPIVSPEPGSAAERAGFVNGDVVLTVNDISPRKFLGAEWWADEAIVGLDVKVLRDGAIVPLRLDLPATEQVAGPEKAMTPRTEAAEPELRVLFRPGRDRRQFPADGVPNDRHQHFELVEYMVEDLALPPGQAEEKVDRLTFFERVIADIEIRTRSTTNFTCEYDALQWGGSDDNSPHYSAAQRNRY
jgi:hypothetical protein